MVNSLPTSTTLPNNGASIPPPLHPPPPRPLNQPIPLRIARQIETRSWNPRAFIYRKFLTKEECDHLIQLAKDKLEKSMVADNESGKSIESTVWTSSGMFLGKGQDDVVSRIEARIATWPFLSLKNGEAMQILHYENGQMYEPHFDYFHDKVNQQLGGHRVATVLMLKWAASEDLRDNDNDLEYFISIFMLGAFENGRDALFFTTLYGILLSHRIPSGIDHELAFKPRKGDALLFFSLHPDATTDTSSLHGSCPVIEGEKWSATKWIHVKSFDKPVQPVEQGECADENPNCAQWAAAGECKKNPLYMVGSDSMKGYCRKSCKVC
ncbi:putative prolyl 4-hydroxylase 7 [Drosera capensis]